MDVGSLILGLNLSLNPDKIAVLVGTALVLLLLLLLLQVVFKLTLRILKFGCLTIGVILLLLCVLLWALPSGG
ncbi:MAG TPA: hypothetical protein ENF52_01810 [Chloroflexi bacterium]|nr:hypothetical protein [Chloroflexota bacterium]